MDIYDVLEKYGSLDSKNYSRARLKANFNQYVNTWQAYYRGDVAGVNTDSGFNGEGFYEIHRRSMRVAKLIAQKWATGLFTEAFKVTLKNDTETEKFNALEKQVDFRAKINQAAIFGYAEGTTALLASADIDSDACTDTVTGGKVKLDVIRYDSIFPLIYDKDDIQAVAFVRQEQKLNTTVYTIGIHSHEKDKVVVENVIATVKGENVDFTVAETVKQRQEYPCQLYCVIKPNTANDFTDLLPFGQSIFSDALAPCVDVDLAADLLRRDVSEGAQITFVGRDLLMQSVSKDGEKKKLFDNTKGRFFVIPQDLAKGGSDIKQLFEKSVPEIRADHLWKVVSDALSWACMTSGLGKNSLDIVPMATATQVIHTEADKMQSKSLHEQYLEGQIIKLVKGLCELSGMTGNPIDCSDLNIVWEDSVIVDTAEQKRISMLEVEAGLITKAEYRMKYFGETEQEAEAKIPSNDKASFDFAGRL
jgi:A118 family predicted phage portal protein